MTVLLYNRDPSMWPGGDMVQLAETMQALEDLGHTCDFSSDPEHDFSPYDMVHSFHVNFDWSVYPPAQRMQVKKPYVISSIFYPMNYGVSFPAIRKMIEESKATIALSQKEKEEIVSLTQAPYDKIHVIPNGVDPDLWQKRGRDKKGAVITFARLQPEKGLLQAAIACKALGLDYRIYGAMGFDTAFERLLLANGATLMGHYPAETLALEAQKACMYVCPSHSERQSLGVLEAAAAGLPIVDSIYNRGATFLPSSTIVDPLDEVALEAAIRDVYANGEDNTDKVPTWKEVATQIVALYES